MSARKALAAALGVAAALLGAELFARAVLSPEEQGNLTPVPSSLVQPAAFDGVRYVLRPRAEAKHSFGSDPDGYFDPGASLTYRINSLGLRGPETTMAKPAETLRILGLGDSFTFGTGVRSEDTFLSVLQERLDPTRRRIEVLNMGVMGYDALDSVNLFGNVGLDFEPDVVVFCFFLNDTGAGGATHAVFNVETDEAELGFWSKNSRLVRTFVERGARREAVAQLVSSYRSGFAEDADGWLLARTALGAAAQGARDRDIDFVLMIFPVLWELGAESPFADIHAIIAAFGGEIGVPVLDLLPAFEGCDGPELWAHPANQHPNARAHAIAGEALARFLEDNRLLERD